MSNWNTFSEVYIQVVPIVESIRQTEIDKSKNNYYVDESIVTLHSPDIDNISSSKQSIKLNIIGVAPVDNIQANADAFVNDYASILGKIYDGTIINLQSQIHL